jgi:hypothetical protein
VVDVTIHAKQQSEVVLSVSFLVAEQAVNLCIFPTYISGQSRLKQKLIWGKSTQNIETLPNGTTTLYIW